jgi:hypothetical protein
MKDFNTWWEKADVFPVTSETMQAAKRGWDAASAVKQQRIDELEKELLRARGQTTTNPLAGMARGDKS